MTRIRDLRNLGPASEKMLQVAGIESTEMLAQLGSVKSYLKVINEQLSHTSLNLLYAIEGALFDCDWKEVARDEKSRLLIELDSLQQFEKMKLGEK